MTGLTKIARTVVLTLSLATALASTACYEGPARARRHPGTTGSGARSATTTAPAPADPMATLLERVRYRDANRNRRIDAGDTLTLSFRHPVDASGASVADVAPTSPGDDLGRGARLRRRPGPGHDVVVRLGRGVRLSIFGTYVPNDRRNGTPAALRIVGPGFRGPDGPARGGPVRIIARGPSVLRFLGESYPDDPAWRSYEGSLHAHTGFSDGVGDPARACDHARYRGGLDFFAVTDHLEQIDEPSDKYPETLRQLDRRNVPGAFVTIPGYEWATGQVSIPRSVWTNHVNVLGDRSLMPLSWTLDGFYDLLADRSRDVIGQFNHPGLQERGGRTFDPWDGFAYDARADLRMRLVRTEPRKHHDTLGYIPLLDAGWHVSPQASEDNHEADWGTRGKDRTGVWAAELTRPAILEALREMRTYSTSDLDASIRAVADGRWAMGSTLFGEGPHELEAWVDDEGGEGFERIELVTLGGAVAGSFEPGGVSRARWVVTVDPAGDRWYYFRALQTDGDTLYAAPFFVDR